VRHGRVSAQPQSSRARAHALSRVRACGRRAPRRGRGRGGGAPAPACAGARHECSALQRRTGWLLRSPQQRGYCSAVGQCCRSTRPHRTRHGSALTANRFTNALAAAHTRPDGRPACACFSWGTWQPARARDAPADSAPPSAAAGVCGARRCTHAARPQATAPCVRLRRPLGPAR
jgi:hypothetical protein